MKKKSILTVATSAILAASMMLSGCGNDGGDAGDSSSAGNSSQESSVEESTGGEESSAEESAGGEESTGGDEGGTTASTYPIVEPGSLELDIFMLSMPNVEDFATNDFTKYMEDLTGIHMNFYTAGRDDVDQKLPMLLNPGDQSYPDILMVDPGIPKYGVKEGIIIPLDEYLNEDIMPNYMKMMSQFDINVTRETDGKIYSLANINDCFHCKYARKMWVNTRLLGEIGCEIPTTTEEFKDVCQKFVEKFPDGVAVAGADTGWFVRMQDWILGAYTFIPSSTNKLALDKTTGTVVNVAATDAYKEGLKYINELYEIGAIDDGCFTQTSEDMKRLVNTTDVLFFPAGTISDIIDSVSANELYREYAPMAPIAGPDGTRNAWTQPNYGVSAGGVMITDACPDVEAALRWVDFFYSETGDLCSQYGAEEGVDWVLNPEGKVGLNDEPAFCEILNSYSGEAQNHDWQDVCVRVAPEAYRLGWAVDADVDPYTPDGLEKLLFDASKELYEPYGSSSNIVNFSSGQIKFTDEEATDSSTLATEVTKIITENSAAFMRGEKNFESDWDKFLSDMESAGASQLVEMYQTAYDRAN